MSVTYTVMRTICSGAPPAARTTASVLSSAAVNWLTNARSAPRRRPSRPSDRPRTAGSNRAAPQTVIEPARRAERRRVDLVEDAVARFRVIDRSSALRSAQAPARSRRDNAITRTGLPDPSSIFSGAATMTAPGRRQLVDVGQLRQPELAGAVHDRVIRKRRVGLAPTAASVPTASVPTPRMSRSVVRNCADSLPNPG